MKKILNLITYILWMLDVVYIPEWDNVPSPFVKSDVPKQKDVPKSIQVLDDLKVYEYGAADPTQTPVHVRYKEQEQDEDNSDAVWTFQRFDGTSGSVYDFKAWHKTDEQALIKYNISTTKQTDNYKNVRMLVMEGKTNKQIALALSKGVKWAENYGAAVRWAFRVRAESLENYSPTED